VSHGHLHLDYIWKHVDRGATKDATSYLGYVQLTEPQRFRAPWEQAASLRLRAGDATVLAEYDQHARICGGDPEQMMDAAAAAYLALTADGTDTLLMAADHTLRRELSRRVRDDLIRLGHVQPGPAVTIADGAAASPGDLIICTANDHRTEAGEPGRTLANGDLLRIDAITPNGLLVRRALDPAPGPRPAPELARYDQIQTERAGVPAPATDPAPRSEALAVLSAVLERDGQLTSATQDQHHAHLT
jgi:hypothetical protein